MKNKQSFKPTIIICGDIHLREDQPICRTDSFLDAQWRKLDFIWQLQKQYDCLVLCGGDLFENWKPSPYLLTETIKHLPNQFYTVYGNHDLPNHNLDLAYKSGINTLKEAGKLEVLPDCSWGQTPDKGFYIPEIHKSILVWHILTYSKKLPFPGCKESSARVLLKKYPQFPLIITSDNHQTFVEEYQGRYLINPGSMTRQKSDQIDHKPCVFLWEASTNKIEQVFLPIEPGNLVITREHIEKDEARDSRIQAFIEKLTDESITDVNFQDNLKQFLSQNPLKKSVVNYIYKALERL